MKRLTLMTTEDVKNELSIAGSREKLIEMMSDIGNVMARVDQTNAAELINLDFILRRLHAEARVWMKMYEAKTGQKILPGKSRADNPLN